MNKLQQIYKKLISRKLISRLNKMGKHEGGNVLIIVGLVFPVILFGIGAGTIDFARWYNTRSSLAQAVSATALAGGKFVRVSDQPTLETMMHSIYDASMQEVYSNADQRADHTTINYYYYSGTPGDPTNPVTRLSVVGTVTSYPRFLQYFGFTSIQQTETSTVTISAKNLDVSFVADNWPGTYPDYNNKSYQLSSMEYVVDQLTVGNPEKLRIGVVPQFIGAPDSLGSIDGSNASFPLVLQMDPMPLTTSTDLEKASFTTWLKFNYSFEPLFYYGRFIKGIADGTDYGKWLGPEHAFMSVLPRTDIADNIFLFSGICESFEGQNPLNPGAYCIRPDNLGFGVKTATMADDGGNSATALCIGITSIEDTIAAFFGVSQIASAVNIINGYPCSYALAAPMSSGVTQHRDINGNWPRAYAPLGTQLVLAAIQLVTAGSEPVDPPTDGNGIIPFLLNRVGSRVDGILTAIGGLITGTLFPQIASDITDHGSRKAIILMTNDGYGMEMYGYHTAHDQYGMNPGDVGGIVNGSSAPGAWYNGRSELPEMPKELETLINIPSAVCDPLKNAGVEIFSISKGDPFLADDANLRNLLTAFMEDPPPEVLNAVAGTGITMAVVAASKLMCISGPSYALHSTSTAQFRYFTGGAAALPIPAQGSVALGLSPAPSNDMADTQHKHNLDQLVNDLMTVDYVAPDSNPVP